MELMKRIVDQSSYDSRESARVIRLELAEESEPSLAEFLFRSAQSQVAWGGQHIRALGRSQPVE
jgi:hypothetical protein